MANTRDPAFGPKPTTGPRAFILTSRRRSRDAAGNDSIESWAVQGPPHPFEDEAPLGQAPRRHLLFPPGLVRPSQAPRTYGAPTMVSTGLCRRWRIVTHLPLVQPAIGRAIRENVYGYFVDDLSTNKSERKSRFDCRKRRTSTTRF